MTNRSKPIINPQHFNLPRLEETVYLFFILQQFYQFQELVRGNRIKSYGPAKRFRFIQNGIPCSVLGGFFGAPLAAIIVENALASGGKTFKSFGTAGWLDATPEATGTIHFPEKGWDNTGMIDDYGSQNLETTFSYSGWHPTCEYVVTVNSFYRLTSERLNQYRKRRYSLIDMEATPLNHIILNKGATFQPLFIVSDRIDADNQWLDGTGSSAFKSGVEKGLQQLLT